jgi:hypothetical protein
MRSFVGEVGSAQVATWFQQALKCLCSPNYNITGNTMKPYYIRTSSPLQVTSGVG